MKSKTTVEKKPKELIKKDATTEKEKEETKNVIKKDDSKTEKVSKKADEAVEQNMNEFSGKVILLLFLRFKFSLLKLQNIDVCLKIVVFILFAKTVMSVFSVFFNFMIF